VVDLLGLVRRDYEDRRLRSMPSAVASMGHVAMHLGELALPLEPEDLSEYLHKRRAERAAEGTIRIELILLHKGFKLAAIRKFISLDSIPEFPKIDKRGLKVRQGYFTREEFNLLLRYLRFEELRDLIAFLYESAWRSGVAMHTQWEWVAHERILVPGEFTKNGKPQVLALAGNIATIIERRRARAIGPYVFHRQGQRIRNFRHAWNTACLRAGLVQANGKPRLPHDLRRSGVTEMDEMGIDRKIGKSISGHLTDSTYERYHIGSLKAQREALEARANGGKKEPPVRAGQKVVRLSDWGT
jgi:integrase